jgi:hypothetical protein
MTAPREELEPITELETITRYLRYAHEFRETFSLLVEPEQLRLETLVASFVDDGLRLGLEIPPESFQHLTDEEKALLDAPAQKFRLSFAVNDILFFARSELVKRNVRVLDLKVKPPIYKLQRRDAVRIKLLDSQDGSITIAGKTYFLHDLSASGLSFETTSGHENDFPPRTMIQSCVLRFSGLEAKVNLEVMGVSKMKKDNLLKVGFRFMGLSPAIEQKIAREAYLHTHKIWNRWI